MNKRQINFCLGVWLGAGVAIACFASVTSVFWVGMFISIVAALGYIAQD